LFFIGQPLFGLLTFFESLLGNCGWAIIIIKLVFPRLSAASYRSMANMRRVDPNFGAYQSAQWLSAYSYSDTSIRLVALATDGKC